MTRTILGHGHGGECNETACADCGCCEHCTDALRCDRCDGCRDYSCGCSL